MNANASKGTFWQSTAAMITAIATLIASLVGLAAFLVGQQVFGGGEPGPWTPPSGAPQAGPPVVLDNDDVLWGPTEFRLERFESIDFDGDGPNRNGGGPDMFLWDGAEVSGPYDIYVWPAAQPPTATDCATFLASHGTGDYVPIEDGTRLCVRTNEGRTVALQAKRRDGDAWLFDGTVWRPRK